jgi:hypothetical protein
MLPFTLAAVHRADHVFPLLPAAALLAGREIARLANSLRGKWLPTQAAAATCALLALIGYYYFVPRAQHPMVAKTAQMQDFSATLQQRGISRLPLVHVDTPFALQFYLNSMNRRVSPLHAADLLRGDARAIVVVRNVERIDSQLDSAEKGALHELVRCPETGEPYIRIISNRPASECVPVSAASANPLTLRTHRNRVASPFTSSESALAPIGPMGKLALPYECSRILGQFILLVTSIAMAFGIGGFVVWRSVAECDSW